MAISFLNLVTLMLLKRLQPFRTLFFIRDFTNPIDLGRIDQALKDEGTDLKVLKPEWAFLNSPHSKPDFARNPFNQSVFLNSAQACLAGEPSSSCRNSSPTALKLRK